MQDRHARGENPERPTKPHRDDTQPRRHAEARVQTGEFA